MRIVNAMFSRDLGGIEQAFINYCKVLHMLGHKVTAVILPNAKVKQYILGLGDINIIEINNLGNWDQLAKRSLKTIIKQVQPEIIINHGSRAAMLLEGSSNLAKNIGVLHNYSVKRFEKMDFLS